MATTQELIAQLTAPDIPGSPYSNATRDYVNPYYAGEGPSDYQRFDINQEGAGIQFDKNPAQAFDTMFGSRYLDPLDIGNEMQSNLLSGLWTGGLGGAAQREIVGDSVSPELQRAIDYNDNLSRYSGSKYGYEGLDKFYRDAFDAHGLDASSIGSLDAINALDPDTKASVQNYVAVMKQQQNQTPNFGFDDFLSTGLQVAGALTGNPYLAAGGSALGGVVQGDPLGTIARNALIAGGTSWAGGEIDALGGLDQVNNLNPSAYGALDFGLDALSAGNQIRSALPAPPEPRPIEPLSQEKPSVVYDTPIDDSVNWGQGQFPWYPTPDEGGAPQSSAFNNWLSQRTSQPTSADVIQPGGVVPSGTIDPPPTPPTTTPGSMWDNFPGGLLLGDLFGGGSPTGDTGQDGVGDLGTGEGTGVGVAPGSEGQMISPDAGNIDYLNPVNPDDPNVANNLLSPSDPMFNAPPLELLLGSGGKKPRLGARGYGLDSEGLPGEPRIPGYQRRPFANYLQRAR